MDPRVRKIASRSRLDNSLRGIYAALMLSLMFAAQAAVSDLSLTCRGSVLGAVPVETTSVSAVTSTGGRAVGSGVRSEVVSRDVDLSFRIEQGQAKLRLPSALLPQIRSGNAGWFKVSNLTVTENEISGRVAINFLSRPTFRIDRRTGEISSSGGFHGVCAADDLTQRKF